jgi:hypothetical protein
MPCSLCLVMPTPKPSNGRSERCVCVCGTSAFFVCACMSDNLGVSWQLLTSSPPQLALKVHPDKNKAPAAEAAFKCTLYTPLFAYPALLVLLACPALLVLVACPALYSLALPFSLFRSCFLCLSTLHVACPACRHSPHPSLLSCNSIYWPLSINFLNHYQPFYPPVSCQCRLRVPQ